MQTHARPPKEVEKPEPAAPPPPTPLEEMETFINQMGKAHTDYNQMIKQSADMINKFPGDEDDKEIMRKMAEEKIEKLFQEQLNKLR